MLRLWRTREVGGGLAAAVFGVGSVIALGALGWPGSPYDCLAHGCYCERSLAGLVRQPGNTWSNLGPVVLGVVLAFELARRRLSRRDRGQLRPDLDLIGLLAPPSLVFEGVGSMYFHGGLTGWGAAVDAMSMFAIVGLLISAQLLRLGWFGPRGLLAAWLGLNVAGLVAGLVVPAQVGNLVFVLFVSLLGTEVVLSRRGASPSPSLFRLGVAIHVTGVGVWFFSSIEGMPLCSPDSPWQGHALWHLTAATAVTLCLLHVLRNLALRPPGPGTPASKG